MVTQAPQAGTTSIDPATHVGMVALNVADLARSLEFYTASMGFTVLQHTDADAILGVAGTPLLLLREQAGARPWPTEGVTGLYHFAILVPTRADLGRWLRHFLDTGNPVPGQGDHLVSEALYIRDPDEHGIEVYRDRPRSEWHWDNGRVQMASNPVDVRGLFAAAQESGQPWTGLSAGTTIGHIHLQIGDIRKAEAFYHGILGFDVVAAMPSALFVSAGGYHHHIGLNIWHSRGASPAPEHTASLRYYTLALPGDEALAAVVARIAAAGIDYQQVGEVVIVKDPWQNTILLHKGDVTDASTAVALDAAPVVTPA